MALTVTGSLAEVLAGGRAAARLEVEAWGLGVDCKGGVYVLNLYAQGQNYPEIVAPAAVAGVVAALAAARPAGAKVYYWPSETASVLFVGRFPT